jgi:hypothetical protein
MLNANSYVFRHQRECNNNKGSQVQHVRLRFFVVMKLSEDGALVPKHVGVGIKHEVWFMICCFVVFYLMHLLVNLFSVFKLLYLYDKIFNKVFSSSRPFCLDLLVYLNYIINQIFKRKSRALRTFILKIAGTAVSVTFKKWEILKFSSASSVSSSAFSFPRSLLILLRRAVLNYYLSALSSAVTRNFLKLGNPVFFKTQSNLCHVNCGQMFMLNIRLTIN